MRERLVVRSKVLLRRIIWRLRLYLIRARIFWPGTELHMEFDNAWIGFFGQMNFCLYAARIARLRGKRLFITLSSVNYRNPDSSRCWFHYFFEERHGTNGRKGARPIRISDSSQLPITADGLSLEDCGALFSETFQVRSDVKKILNEAGDRLGIGLDTLGVHFRGTDKHSEAEPVEPDEALIAIRTLLDQLPGVRNLFIASDNAHFVARVHREIAQVPVVSLSDSARSTSNEPVHLNGLKLGNRDLGLDALLNSMLLARCGWLIRTSSFLSAWSSVFNPALPVFLLNEPRPGKLWFPENRIVDRAVMLGKSQLVRQVAIP